LAGGGWKNSKNAWRAEFAAGGGKKTGRACKGGKSSWDVLKGKYRVQRRRFEEKGGKKCAKKFFKDELTQAANQQR